MLLEDYKADTEYRELAAKMAEIIILSISKHKKDVLLNDEFFIIDISKDMSELGKQFTKFDFALLFYNGINNKNYACAETVIYGKKCIVFKLPFLYAEPKEVLEDMIFNRHKRKFLKLYHDIISNGGTQSKATEIINNEGKNCVGEYLVQTLKAVINTNDFYPTIVHECIHALDKMRYSSTYVHKKEETDTEEGKNEYYNRVDEQHAYLQQTLYIIDKWVKEKFFDRTSFKNFNEFYDMFVSQYRGSYNRLTPSNKRRIQKKLYVYYRYVFSTPKYQSYSNPKY